MVIACLAKADLLDMATWKEGKDNNNKRHLKEEKSLMRD